MKDNLLRQLKKVQDEVNHLQDLIDIYFDEQEMSEQLLEELDELRTSLPSHSAFSEAIELVEEEVDENE
ncbi:hypothetical protein M3659_09870 [Niallia sp. MER TA 168]|nr:hypothetical protein [Niallia sp. MER TA 168]